MTHPMKTKSTSAAFGHTIGSYCPKGWELRSTNSLDLQNYATQGG